MTGSGTLAYRVAETPLGDAASVFASCRGQARNVDLLPGASLYAHFCRARDHLLRRSSRPGRKLLFDEPNYALLEGPRVARDLRAKFRAQLARVGLNAALQLGAIFDF